MAASPRKPAKILRTNSLPLRIFAPEFLSETNRPQAAFARKPRLARQRTAAPLLRPVEIVDVGVDRRERVLSNADIFGVDEHHREISHREYVIFVIHVIDRLLVDIAALLDVFLDSAKLLRLFDHWIGATIVAVAVEEEVHDVVHVWLRVGRIEPEKRGELALAAQPYIERQWQWPHRRPDPDLAQHAGDALADIGQRLVDIEFEIDTVGVARLCQQLFGVARIIGRRLRRGDATDIGGDADSIEKLRDLAAGNHGFRERLPVNPFHE